MIDTEFCIGGEAQAAGFMIVHHHGLEARFEDGHFAAFQGGNGLGINVHTDDVIAHLGETGTGYESDVAGAKHGDLHASLRTAGAQSYWRSQARKGLAARRSEPFLEV